MHCLIDTNHTLNLTTWIWQEQATTIWQDHDDLTEH